MPDAARRDMQWREEPRRGALLLCWLRRLGILAGIGGLVTGALFAVQFMSTPAILLEHQPPRPILPAQPPAQPISPYAQTHVASGALPTSRTGLWLEIPDLNIALPIRDGDGSNNIPDWVALHYPGTAQPGAPGNSYLYAHGIWGMFGALLFAHDGEQVILRNYTSHSSTTFRISRVVGRVRYDDVSWITERSATPLLTLQTCVGADIDTDRWIVQATV